MRTKTMWLLSGVHSCSVAPGSAAPPNSPLDHINITYRGGPLLQNVKVSTLFWGSSWSGSPTPAYLTRFFTALFARLCPSGSIAERIAKPLQQRMLEFLNVGLG